MNVFLAYSFFKMKKLSVVRLSSNHIIDLPQEIVDNCSIQHLDLHCNQLSSLPEQLFRKLKKYVCPCLSYIEIVCH